MPVDVFSWPWERVTTVMLLGVALVGGWRRWWVFGGFYAEMKAERDAAISLREKDNETLERLVRLLEERDRIERERR